MQITLKAARTNAGLTQGQAANELGVSRYTISNWERGKSFPNTKLISKIEKVYKTPYKNIVFLPKNNA